MREAERQMRKEVCTARMSERRFLKTQWVDLGRVSLRFALHGPPDADGPPLLLLHEMAASMETWEPAIELLAREHRVAAYDWRGCGGSEKIIGAVSMDDHVGDLAAFLDHLAFDRAPVIAGVAVGAAIAASFAARHPDRLSGLVLISPAMGVPADQRSEREKQIADLERDGLRSIVTKSMDGGYPAHLREGREAAFEAFRARWISGDVKSFAATYRMLLAIDMPPVLRRIACPTLLIAGEFDPVRHPDYVRELTEMIVGARMTTVPGGHHMPHQIPQICAEELAGFAASLGDAGS